MADETVTDAAAAEEEDGRTVNLMSQEGDQFQVEVKVAKMSELVKTMIPEEAEDEEDAQEIPLPNVKSHVLAKVIEFCRHYAEEPMSEIEKPLKSANMHEVVQEWYANYVDVDQELLFELILAANYMDIKPLLDLTCAKVASMIKGKTPEEIEHVQQAPPTPEEEAQVREECSRRRPGVCGFAVCVKPIKTSERRPRCRRLATVAWGSTTPRRLATTAWSTPAIPYTPLRRAATRTASNRASSRPFRRRSRGRRGKGAKWRELNPR